jgi:hypothetical protein
VDESEMYKDPTKIKEVKGGVYEESLKIKNNKP